MAPHAASPVSGTASEINPSLFLSLSLGQIDAFATHCAARRNHHLALPLHGVTIDQLNLRHGPDCPPDATLDVSLLSLLGDGEIEISIDRRADPSCASRNRVPQLGR